MILVKLQIQGFVIKVYSVINLSLNIFVFKESLKLSWNEVDSLLDFNFSANWYVAVSFEAFEILILSDFVARKLRFLDNRKQF